MKSLEEIIKQKCKFLGKNEIPNEICYSMDPSSI